MANYRVIISELTAAAGKIANEADAFSTCVGTLQAAVDELALTWEGDSQAAFVAEQAAAMEWYNKMVNIVMEHVSAMQLAAQKYQEADAEAAAIIRQR